MNDTTLLYGLMAIHLAGAVIGFMVAFGIFDARAEKYRGPT